jgi:hypothetical protein
MSGGSVLPVHVTGHNDPRLLVAGATIGDRVPLVVAGTTKVVGHVSDSGGIKWVSHYEHPLVGDVEATVRRFKGRAVTASQVGGRVVAFTVETDTHKLAADWSKDLDAADPHLDGDYGTALVGRLFAKSVQRPQ